MHIFELNIAFPEPIKMNGKVLESGPLGEGLQIGDHPRLTPI